MDFSGGPVVKNLPANVGDVDLIPGPGRFHMLWGNEAHTPYLPKPTCSRAYGPQQEKSPP